MQNLLVSHAHDFCLQWAHAMCNRWREGGKGGSAQAHIMLHDVPGCSTTFFFFCVLSPTVVPAAEVTGAAAGAVR